MAQREVVITGCGVVTPIGAGTEAFWSALLAGHCGIGRITAFDPTGYPGRLCAQIGEFNPQNHIRPRKALKVMSHDTQLGMAAADMACRQSGMVAGQIDPERMGVVFAADKMRNGMQEIADGYRASYVDGRFDFRNWDKALASSFPLGMLKTLPNMLAAHISIAEDARGPNNTIHQGDVSSLQAISEAAQVIQRGLADLMVVGGAESPLHPFQWLRRGLIDQMSQCEDPARACRPFEANRDGQVRGEGAGALVIEERGHAEARGARILGRILGWTSSCQPRLNGHATVGAALKRAITAVLAESGLQPGEIGHINAHGLSTRDDDQVEAQVLHQIFGDTPVIGLKSYFGNLGAASGTVELIGSLLAFHAGLVPPTLNYEQPDPECPITVVRGQPLGGQRATALTINFTPFGQVSAMVVAGASG